MVGEGAKLSHIGPESLQRSAKRFGVPDAAEAGQVAMQLSVLKPVVENEDLALQLLDSRLSQFSAVGPLEVRHIGQVLFQDHRFVVPASLRAVAPAEDRHALVVALAVESGDPLDA